MEIDNLPNDVLMKIFSMLDPSMLLGSVQLVCKRWTELARHADSWVNAKLRLYDGMMSRDKRAAERIARLAPHLHLADFSDVDRLDDFNNNIVMTLLKSEKSIKWLYTFPTSSKKMRVWTQKLLRKFSPSLRGIRLVLKDPSLFVPNQLQKSSKLVPDLIKILKLLANSIPRLNKITFWFCTPVKIQKYNGFLGNGCPKLKKIQVVNSYLADASWVSVFVDVLGKKHEILEEVEIGAFMRSHPEVGVVLRTCRNLEKCILPIECLPAIQNMTQLKCLGVTLYYNSVEAACLDTSVKSFILSSNVITNITELIIAGELRSLIEDVPSSDSGLDNNTEPYRNTLMLLTEKCQNSEVLRGTLLDLKENLLISFTMHMLKLWAIYLSGCCGIQPVNFLHLCESTKVRYLGGMVFVNSSREERKLETALEHAAKSGITTDVFVNLFDDYSDDESDDYYDGDNPYFYDSYDDDYQFTYFDYLRNKYGEDLEDHELYAFMSSDED